MGESPGNVSSCSTRAFSKQPHPLATTLILSLSKDTAPGRSWFDKLTMSGLEWTLKRPECSTARP